VVQVRSLVALGVLAAYVPGWQTVHPVHAAASVTALKVPASQAGQARSFVEVEAVAT
jgi:hypothetical protein